MLGNPGFLRRLSARLVDRHPHRGSRFALLVAMACALAVAACGDPDPPLPAESSEPPPLAGIAAFQRGSDVYVQDIGGAPRLLVENASYPRWSPDGESVAVVSGKRILVVEAGSGKVREIARADDPVAVAWHPDGSRVYYTDGKSVRAAPASGGVGEVIATGYRLLEMDVGPGGRTLVGTHKGFDYEIVWFDLESGENRTLEAGCSASFSPDGALVSNLLGGHQRLALISVAGGGHARVLNTPGEVRYDNHFWTNHPDWIAGELEGDRRDIVLIHAGDGRIRKITDVGNASRGDVHIRTGG